MAFPRLRDISKECMVRVFYSELTQIYILGLNGHKIQPVKANKCRNTAWKC